MKKIFTLLLFGLSLSVLPLAAQDEEEIDMNYIFVDKNGNPIENGATIICDVTEFDESGQEMISSGISVKNVSAGESLFLKMHYEITEISNGSFQICFPMNCNFQEEEGFYETGVGSVSGTQDILSEWFPDDYGVCEVVLTIETMTKVGGFPPRYVHSGTGCSITVRFMKLDKNYVFVDQDGNLIDNGATIIRNVTEFDESGQEMISSGISVKNVSAPESLYLKMNYEITQISNGSFQICFPMNCNYQSEVGIYETVVGSVSGTQDILTEWFPDDNGECEVILNIETMTKVGGFPPRYVHSGTGPTITVRFVKGEEPQPGVKGDVNGDGEVGLGDINYLIDLILSTDTVVGIGDVNNDGEVSIADINAVIDIILTPTS